MIFSDLSSSFSGMSIYLLIVTYHIFQPLTIYLFIKYSIYKKISFSICRNGEGKIMKDIDFGTIRIKLADVMEDQQVSINKLAFRAEMQRTQLKAYKNNEIQRIDLSVLARLCYALDCDIKDLIEYLPPDEKK